MGVLALEAAKTARSTCRATGESIPKDSWRVGMEAYVGGRVVMTWQKPRPFLENCFVEQCKTSTGSCKASGHKFKKGEARFVATSKEKKVFFTFTDAAKEVGPILSAVPDFRPTDFKGLTELPQDQQKEFANAFGVSMRKARLGTRSSSVDLRRSRRTQIVAPLTPLSEPKDQEKNIRNLEGGTVVHVVDERALESAAKHRSPKKEPAPQFVPESPTAHLSEYEKQRLANIARNKARLLELQLPTLIAKLAPPAPVHPVQPRGLATKRKKPEADAPRRMSLRQRGVASDGVAVDEELRGGKVVVIDGERIRLGPNALREPSPPKDRHPQGTLPFKSNNGKETSDAAFLALLRMEAKRTTTSKQGEKLATPSSKQLSGLRLQANDIAKVTRDGVVHLAFHPSTDCLLLAAADKDGHIGLWDVDHARLAGGTGKGEEPSKDDVLEFKHHYSYVCGLRWAGGSGAHARLFTCAYDGSVRMLDPTVAASELVFSDEDAEYSAFDVTSDGATVYVGDKDGNLEVVDVRTRSSALPAMSLHDKKINTLHVEPGEERQLASACADNAVAIWDVRKLGRGAKPLARAAHGRTCQSAFWASDGSQRVLTTSRDNTIKVWDGKKGLAQLLSISHNNDTGRWISPFRATWGHNAESIIIGNMKRTVDIYDSAGSPIVALSSENMTAICARNVVHPQLPVLGSGSGSGRMYVWR